MPDTPDVSPQNAQFKLRTTFSFSGFPAPLSTINNQLIADSPSRAGMRRSPRFALRFSL
jgi:hypothetical protein